MWTIFKAFIEFVTKLLLFYVLDFWSRGMWDLALRPGIECHLLRWKAKSRPLDPQEALMMIFKVPYPPRSKQRCFYYDAVSVDTRQAPPTCLS